jgi:mono/diheme cytochrome c family protein
MNLTNHEVAWRRLLDERCAGTVTTAGGLIFAGRYNGELTAMDSETGRRLWSFQTDGGFTTTVTIFEHAGAQYLAGIAGGGVTGGRLNDGLWLFSLNGTIESLPPGSGEPLPEASSSSQPAAADGSAGAERGDLLADLDPSRAGDLEQGGRIYRAVCRTCHGETGEGGHEQGAPLSPGLSIVDIVATAQSGVPGTAMAPVGGAYSLAQLQDIASYIVGQVLSRP